MGVKEQLIAEIARSPEPLLRELLEFARSLRSVAGAANAELAVLSESALAKDWLVLEENDAWADL